MSLEGHLQPCGCAVSGAGICESWPEEGMEHESEDIPTYTHTNPAIFLLCFQ